MNLAHHLAKHFKAMEIQGFKTRIIFGGLITLIAMATVNFVEANYISVKGSNLLYLAYFSVPLRRLQGEHQLLHPGSMYWMFGRDMIFFLPDPEGRTRFLPSQEHYLYVGENIDPLARPQQPQQPEHEARVYFRRGRQEREGGE